MDVRAADTSGLATLEIGVFLAILLPVLLSIAGVLEAFTTADRLESLIGEQIATMRFAPFDHQDSKSRFAAAEIRVGLERAADAASGVICGELLLNCREASRYFVEFTVLRVRDPLLGADRVPRLEVEDSRSRGSAPREDVTSAIQLAADHFRDSGSRYVAVPLLASEGEIERMADGAVLVGRALVDLRGTFVGGILARIGAPSSVTALGVRSLRREVFR